MEDFISVLQNFSENKEKFDFFVSNYTSTFQGLEEQCKLALKEKSYSGIIYVANVLCGGTITIKPVHVDFKRALFLIKEYQNRSSS